LNLLSFFIPPEIPSFLHVDFSAGTP
jgi:hypothetical protein